MPLKHYHREFGIFLLNDTLELRKEKINCKIVWKKSAMSRNSRNECSTFSLLTPPIPAAYISFLPLSPVPLNSGIRPTPLFLCLTLFSAPLILHFLLSRPSCSSHSTGVNRSKKPLPPHCWKHSVSPALHPWSSASAHILPLPPPLLCPPPLPPLTSPPSLQFSSSLPELTLSLAFVLTGQSPRAEHPHLLFDLPLPPPSLLSLPSSPRLLTHSSAVQPSG